MNCPKCGAESVATLIVGDVTHGYCPKCDPPFFPPLGPGWSPWDANWDKHVKKGPETVKQRRERMLHGKGVWG